MTKREYPQCACDKFKHTNNLVTGQKSVQKTRTSVRRILSPCEKISRPQDKNLVTSASPTVFSCSFQVCWLGASLFQLLLIHTGSMK